MTAQTRDVRGRRKRILKAAAGGLVALVAAAGPARGARASEPIPLLMSAGVPSETGPTAPRSPAAPVDLPASFPPDREGPHPAATRLAPQQRLTMALPTPMPATTVGAFVGGGVPGAVGGGLVGERGVHRFLAARAMALGLAQIPGRTGRGRFVATVGPSFVLDAVAWVPHAYAQVGITAAPLAPCVAVGAEIERYVSLRISVRAWLQATWLGPAQFRGDAMAGVGYALF